MIHYPESNFSQHQFDTPIKDDEIDSPPYLYEESQISNYQNPSQQSVFGQAQASQSQPSQSPRRGFSLGTMFGNRKKSIEQKPNDTKAEQVEKVPKRRGPKPDSKPALSRRQQLNRQAQRTHRERKEFYTKALELQVHRLRETSYRVFTEKREMEQSKRITENENRLLRQLLHANNIAYVGSTALQPSRPLLPESSQASRSLPLQDNYSTYYDTDHMMNDFATTALGSQSDMMDSSAAVTTLPMRQNPSQQNSFSPTQASSYNPSDSSNMGLATPSTTGYTTSPPSLPPPENANSLATMGTINATTQQWFTDGNDPTLVNFVVDLEESCKEHAGFLLTNMNNVESADISGHALMFSAPTYSNIPKTPGDYHHGLPDLPATDLNTILASSRSLTRDGEVTPVMAVHMIVEDYRFPAVTREDFLELQANLKGKSRCYGFGAVLEDFEVTDAMNDICAKYGL